MKSFKFFLSSLFVLGSVGMWTGDSKTVDYTFGKVQYMSVDEIHPGQDRLSFLNVNKKVGKALTKGWAKVKGKGSEESTDYLKEGWTPKEFLGKYTLKFDGGKSSLRKKDALPVIKVPALAGPGGSKKYVLIDGHHGFAANLRLGGTTVPIKVVTNPEFDYSKDTPSEFWKKAEKDGLVYPYKMGGAYQLPPYTFDKLVNDPNRYFFAVTSLKCSGPGGTITQSPSNPLWFKSGKGIPYIEFKGADAMYKANMTYDDKGSGKNPSVDYVNKVRTLLLTDKKVQVPGLKVVKDGSKVPSGNAACSDTSFYTTT